MPGLENQALYPQFSPDPERLLLTTSINPPAFMAWDLAEGKAAWKVNGRYCDYVAELNSVIHEDLNGNLLFRNSRTGKVQRRITGMAHYFVELKDTTTDLRRIALKYSSLLTLIVDVETGSTVFKGNLEFCGFSADSSRLALINLTNMGPELVGVQIRDPESGTLLANFAQERTDISAAILRDDGEHFITGHYDGLLRIWERRRPEYWWGVAWLLEFWLTVVLGIGLVVSVVLDQRTLKKTK